MTVEPAHKLRIVLAQVNPTVGDLDGNTLKALSAWHEAKRAGADLVCFPELFITGYPPEDLVLKPVFQDAARGAVEALARDTADGPAVLMGTIWRDGEGLYNAAALLEAGRIAALRFKSDLPNYGVFDEKRVFAAGPLPGPLSLKGVRIGVPICEDIWKEEVSECLAECGAEILISPNGSPFDWPKPDLRMNVAVARVNETGLPLIYLNLVGGQDELVFDGASFVLNADCSSPVQLPAWEEALAVTDWERGPEGWRCTSRTTAVLETGDASAYQACMLGLRDYVDKNGFPGVVLGLSGGIDSALVAALATDALGPERVRAVMLPYRFTSRESLEDAEACARALGIACEVVPIAPAAEGFYAMMAPMCEGRAPGIAEENIQSRVRGTLLMAISNMTGAMVLTTGNKSEMSVGYATLYGDMNGGFNPVKDLYKGEIYRLSRWRNAHLPKGGKGPKGFVIPERILTKAPSAELKPNQTDQDSLPPYDALDDILRSLVEREEGVADIIARGHDRETVLKVERLLYLAEYKRRQAAPGVKISARNFGRDRRYPITNKFREGGTRRDPAMPLSAPQKVAPRADGGDLS